MKDKDNNKLAYLKNISLKIGKQQILNGINLEIKKGEITTLIGPNGGGKTSIAKILIGILKPSSGEVFIRSGAKIGYMPQKILIEKTIPLKVADFLDLIFDQSEEKKQKNEEKTVRKLQEIKILYQKIGKKIGINGILQKSIHQISGGELQKVLLVGALISNPDILVLDEPTQYLDISSQSEFYKIIEEIRQQKNCAILIISHDLHIVMQKTNQVICINRHICCQGNPDSINDHPEYLSLFGNSKTDNIAIYAHHHDHQH